MKKMVKVLVLLLIVMLNLQDWSLAGDSVGFSVSFTIPAIPGVNAPLNQETKTEPKIEEKQITAPSLASQQNQQEEPVFIEEIQETQIAQETTRLRVIYSR